MLTKRDFEAISELRYQIARFLRFSEQAVRGAGITPLQYLLLVHLRGFPGRDWASIAELAVRLQAQHHGVVALVGRCEALGLVTKRASRTDRRQVEVRLAREGEKILLRLALLHRAELRALHRAFGVARISAFNERDLGGAAAPATCRAGASPPRRSSRSYALRQGTRRRAPRRRSARSRP